jgi:hypothetical protein
MVNKWYNFWMKKPVGDFFRNGNTLSRYGGGCADYHGLRVTVTAVTRKTYWVWQAKQIAQHLAFDL